MQIQIFALLHLYPGGLFCAGERDDFITPETPCKEPPAENIQDFVQDTLNAHEESLQNQTAQGPNGHQQNNEDFQAGQLGDGLQRQELERDDKQSGRKEKQAMNPEQAGQQGEKEQVEDYQQLGQSCRIQMVSTEAEAEQSTTVELKSMQCENKQLPLISTSSPEADVSTAHCPGPLVTELEDTEQLETIHLPLLCPLFIDDLPDLEDVDTEVFTEMFTSQQVFRPKIEVISGGSDEDEAVQNQSERIPSFGPDQKSVFLMGGCNKSAISCSSLVYSKDGDVPEPQSSEPLAEKITHQISSPPRCLIEELD